ncbi:MAG: hypothetical protein H8Z69_01985 [Nanohaloarchaea archaeon]|nr:hypothetical protein [Candidatus Nanohaloarchaea archaeon]
MPTTRVIAFSFLTAALLAFSSSASAQNIDLESLNTPNSWSGGDKEGDILHIKADLNNQDTIQTLWFGSHIKGTESKELAAGGSGHEWKMNGVNTRQDGRVTESYLNIGSNTCGLYLVENDGWGYQRGMVQYGEGTIIDADGQLRERNTVNYLLQQDTDGSGTPAVHDTLKETGFRGMSFNNNLDFKQSGLKEIRYSLLCAPEQNTDYNSWRTCQGSKTTHFEDTVTGDVYLCGSGDDDWEVREGAVGSCDNEGEIKSVVARSYLCAPNSDGGGSSWTYCSNSVEDKVIDSTRYSCNNNEWSKGSGVCNTGNTKTWGSQLKSSVEVICNEDRDFKSCDHTSISQTVDIEGTTYTCVAEPSSGEHSWEYTWTSSPPSTGEIDTGVTEPTIVFSSPNYEDATFNAWDDRENGNPSLTQHIYGNDGWKQCKSDTEEAASVGTDLYSCQEQGNDYLWQPAEVSCDAGATKDSPDGINDNYLCTGDNWISCTTDTSVDETYGGKTFACNVEEGARGSFETTGFSCGDTTSIAASISENSYSSFPIEINGCTSQKHFVVKLKSGLHDVEWNYRYNKDLDNAAENGVQCLHPASVDCRIENFDMERDGDEFTITISNDDNSLPWGPKDNPKSEGQPVPYDISLVAYDGSTSGTTAWRNSPLTEVCSSTGMCTSNDVVNDLETTVGIVEHSYGEPITLSPGQQVHLSGKSSQVACAEKITFGGPTTSRGIYFGDGTGPRNSYTLNQIEDSLPSSSNSDSSSEPVEINVEDTFAETSNVVTFARDTTIEVLGYTNQGSDNQRLRIRPVCNEGSGSGSESGESGSDDSAPGSTVVTSFESTDEAWAEACVDGADYGSSDENSDSEQSDDSGGSDFCESEDSQITVDEIVSTLRPCISGNMPKDKSPAYTDMGCYEILKSYCENAGTLSYNGPSSLEGVETKIDNTCSRGGP